MESKIIVVLFIALMLITSAPIINSVYPDYGLNNGPVEVTIMGDKFDHNMVVSLIKPGEPDIMATKVKMISKKELACSFDLTNKTTGKWDLVVTKKSSLSKKPKTATLVNGFDIQYPTPAISKILPNQGPNSKLVTVNIYGAYFREGIQVELSAGDQRIKATNPKVLSNTQLTADFNLSGMAPGIYDVRVTNDDNKSVMLSNGFRISGGPTLDSIAPGTGFNNGSLLTEINGAQFKTGAIVKLISAEQIEIPAFNVKISNTNQISCFFDLNQKPVGSYDVIVMNPDGQTAVLSKGFKIIEFVPAQAGLNNILKPVFFDFDKSEIRPNQMPMLIEDLKLLKENPHLYILLGGHTDERGTREYNFGLSARRTAAIKQFLLDQGIDPAQIACYAYGKDYPLKKGHQETSWSHNRRVDILVWESPPTREQGLTRVLNDVSNNI